MPKAGSSTGPVRTISKGKRHRIASYFRSKGIRYSRGELTLAVPHKSFFRSKSEKIGEEDLRYYHTERCLEAGEEYNSELKWLESESESGAEVGDDRSSGCGSGVEECSSSEYTSPAIVHVEFVRPSGRGYAPDVGGNYEDVGDGLVGPGVPGGSSHWGQRGKNPGGKLRSFFDLLNKIPTTNPAGKS